MKKAKSLIPKKDEIFIIVFESQSSKIIKFDLIKKKDAKEYEDGLLIELGEENFSSKYFPISLDIEDFESVIRAGMIPFLRIMAQQSGHIESEKDKSNYEYYYGKGNTEIN